MKARVLAYLGALPPRTLFIAMGGLVLLLLVESWFLLLRQPATEYLQIRSDRAALEAYLRAPQQLPAEISRAERDLAALNAKLAGAGSELAPDRVIVNLMDRLAELAGRHGAALHGVRPAGVKRVLMFDEMAFDIQAAGSYRSLLAWLEDVEKELGPLVVTQFTIKRGAPSSALGMELRLAAYRLADSSGGAK